MRLSAFKEAGSSAVARTVRVSGIGGSERRQKPLAMDDPNDEVNAIIDEADSSQ